MPNNKVLSKIAELNLKNERAKQDIDKQFPREQQIEIWIYELTRFDDKNIPFVANTADGTINVAGYVLYNKTKLYVESESKALFTQTDTQLEISDNQSVNGYIKDQLDFNNKSYFVTFSEFFAGNDLKNVFLISQSNSFDQINEPSIEKVQLKSIAEELSFSNKNKWKLIPTIDTTNYGKIKSVSVNFKQSNIALSALNVYEGSKNISLSTKESYFPYSIVPVSVVGNSADVYVPMLDKFLSLAHNYAGASTNKITYPQLASWLGDSLFSLFNNIVSLCHMVSTGFDGVEEEGHVPGDPSVKITPSAGWIWKGKLEGKEPKAIAAIIQSYVDLGLQYIQTGRYLGSIDSVSGNLYGNIEIAKSVIHDYNYQLFFSILSSLYPQVFSNYTLNYGGTFDGDSIWPFKCIIDNSTFYISSTKGSNIPERDIRQNIIIKWNFVDQSTNNSLANYSSNNDVSIFYYEGSFTTRKSGGVYIIDYQYAKKINAHTTTAELRNSQNDIISSPHAVFLGTPNDWTFVNNRDNFSNNKAGSFTIPQSVFNSMKDPRFYYALTEEEINDYYNEGRTKLTTEEATYYGDVFTRGYPKIPFTNELQNLLKDKPTAKITYLLTANSQMRDDAGSNNDYRLTMSDFVVNVKDINKSFIQNTFKMKTGILNTTSLDGNIPMLRPNTSLTAQNIGKTIGENSAAILSSPRVLIQGKNLALNISSMNQKIGPYLELNNALSVLTNDYNQSYTFSEGDYKPSNITSMGISSLGSGTFSIIFEYENANSESTVISSDTSETNIYSNNLYISSDEDLIETYSLINFGETEV